MPLSPPSVRPVLAALLTVLLLASSVLVSGSATLLPGALAAPAPQPGAPADAPLTMDLVSLTPTSLAPGGTFEAEVEVTNTSSEPLPALALELRTRTARVTDRGVIANWQADTSPETTGAPLTTSAEHEQLAPGESVVLTVRVDADELGYSEESYYWGTRRIALTVTSDGEALAALRTFVVWRPEDAEDTITQSVLLPVTAEDPAAVVADPEARAASLEKGQLATVKALAPRGDVDWWLDPSLLDPPRLPVDEEPAQEGDESASPTPAPVRTYTEDPASVELADLLDETVGERTVLAMPYAGADRVSLDAAGTDVLTAAVRARGDVVWDERGIIPRAEAQRVDGAGAEADALEALLAAGVTTAIVPSSSLRADPNSAVTPSSIGSYRSASQDGATLDLLAPDEVLSSQFSLLTADGDTELTRQRLLAETATIASEYATAPRHLLIMPADQAALDPSAASAVLDAFADAPWIQAGRTSALLDAADAWTADPRSEDGALYAIGPVDAGGVRPGTTAADSTWAPLAQSEAPGPLDAEVLGRLQDSWEDVDVLAAAMEDDAPLDAPRLEILAATGERWRTSPEIPAARADEAAASAAELRGRIEVVPASGYNVISDKVNVPIRLSNRLDTPITVQVAVTSDTPLVRIGEPQVVKVPARGQVDAAVDVEAVANGTVTLTTTVTTEDGRPLTEPVDVPLTVNPSWENWTTLMLVIAMGLLVVVGVLRARRTGSSTRAPAVHGPEDPEELSLTGRSTPDTHPAERAWLERAGHSTAQSPGSPGPPPRNEKPPTPDTTEDDPA